MFEFLQYDFMIRALIAGCIVSITAPAVGMFLVIRGYSYMADTLAHVSLVGVALGFLFSFHPAVGAIATAIVAAFIMEYLHSKRKVFSDAVLAIFLSGSLALALIFVGAGKVSSTQLFSYLFGSIATVTPFDIMLIAAVGAVVLLLLLLFRRVLFLVAFDEELSRAEGVRAFFYNMLLMALAALTVSVSIRVVGALLIGALMVIPVMSAMQFQKHFRATVALSVVFSVFSTITGLIVSYYANLASGAVIVMVSLFVFLLTLMFGKRS